MAAPSGLEDTLLETEQMAGDIAAGKQPKPLLFLCIVAAIPAWLFTRLLPLNLLYLWFPAFPLLRYLRNYIISEFSLGPKLPPFTFYMTMYASYSGLVAEGWDEWKHLLVATPVLGFLMQTVHIAVWDAVGPRLYAALGVDYEGFIAAQEASSDPAYKKEEEHT